MTATPGRASALVLAVDVGSTSARAGVFDLQGQMLASASAPFEVHRPMPDHAEHDSGQIWDAVGTAVRRALADCGRPAADVVGVGFDAATSLVLLDAAGAPVGVSCTGEDRWNVIMWADHRATAQAQAVTATGHGVLDYIGGVMSPEMQLPKLLWLKQQLPRAWERCALALDLADFLSWKATGQTVLSACTVTCKWTYLNHPAQSAPALAGTAQAQAHAKGAADGHAGAAAAAGWQQDFLAQVGLEDLVRKLRLPAQARPPGTPAAGLSDTTARDWGLTPGIPVAVSLIDAHAGALGVLGAIDPSEYDRQLALIAGTSNCHMALSAQPRAIGGIWGPYFGAVLPDAWLNEGGQSASGALLDHVLDSHALGASLGEHRHSRISEYILRRRAECGAGYASETLVVPDFHGNRSPLARPELRGIAWGLDLDGSIEGLARLYHATAVGIAYGTRHIVDALNARGYRIDRLHLTGGHARSPLLVRLYADATDCTLVLPRESDGVLLGTALLAAAAAGAFPDLRSAGQAMVHQGASVTPDAQARALHARGYAAFRLLLEQREQVLRVLQPVTPP